MATKNPPRKRIDLNRAELDELTLIEGIDGERARLILEYRQTKGAFRSWEEIERVDGIGTTLTEKLRASATIGPPSDEDEDEDEDEVGDEDDDQDEDELAVEPINEQQQVEILTALARLDREAMASYQAAAEAVDLAEIRDQLLAFRDDHRRHVQDLSRLLTARNAPSIDPKGEEQGGSLLRKLAEMMKPLGTGVALMNLIAVEQLTNTSYEAALEFDWEDPVLQLLHRNFSDEHRHLEWLADQEAALAGELEEALSAGGDQRPTSGP